MNKTIALTNHKGGVGKSTTTATLGAALAARGKRVLLIDLDAQANLSSMFLTDEQQEQLGGTIYDSLTKGTALVITNVSENLDIVASSLEMATIEVELSGKLQRETILRKLLKSVASAYDYILLDCPPSLGIVVFNAMAAATELYIPLTAEALPYKGLAMIERAIESVQESLNPSLSLSGIIITMWERSNNSQMVEDALRVNYGSKVFQTKIRKNVAVRESQWTTDGLLGYAPESNAAKDYKALAEEVLARE